jgi:hypothetical protein
MDDYQQALMAMGAEQMARMRQERDDWKKRYVELEQAYIRLARGVIRERVIKAGTAATSTGAEQ